MKVLISERQLRKFFWITFMKIGVRLWLMKIFNYLMTEMMIITLLMKNKY